MTKNLKIYTVFSTVWSVLFFAVLHWALQDAQARSSIILIAAVSYGLGFGLVGELLSRRDALKSTRLNLNFWYYWTSSIASLIIGGAWILLFKSEYLGTLAIMTVIFITVFIAHRTIARRRSVKGIQKQELFK